jgi:hypothetical protein
MAVSLGDDYLLILPKLPNPPIFNDAQRGREKARETSVREEGFIVSRWCARNDEAIIWCRCQEETAVRLK